ncbi:MAG TPA: hypothetical protein VLB05_00915, partial [Dongiaceae bacterium]|nr:hypothetical protein [Dongiaceae bacterium]
PHRGRAEGDDVTTIVRRERIGRAADAGSGLLSRLLRWLFVHRHRTVAAERLSDHLLRDIGALCRHQYRRDRQFR